MARVEVIAKVGFVYDGVPRPVGQPFECETKDLRILRDIGHVELPDGANEPVESESATPAKPKRQYRRRDMTAES